MPTITLLEKAYNAYHLRLVDKSLKDTLEGLKISIDSCKVTSRGWVQITVSGEDEKIALNYLSGRFGMCPSRFESLRKYLAIKGRIESLDKNKGEVAVDIGVFSPDIVDSTIRLNHLQAQLVDGRKVVLKKIIELFGLCRNMSLTIKVLNINEEENRVEAMLAEKQLNQYGKWTDSLLDRLIVLKTPVHDVESALRVAECDRDVVDIEPLGLFEHAVVCKLGTDAAGLIPKIGRNLEHATFSVFSPRRIMGFLDGDLPSFTSS